MPYQQLYKNIFSQSLTDSGSEEALKSITNSFPYFSAAYFFLLKKTEQLSVDHPSIAAKTALHFNNPFLLNLQLNREMPETISETVIEPTPVQTVEVLETVAEEKNIETSEILKESVALATTEETEIAFEPLHTTDYFASQGIKITEEVQPADKLGKQLKSFTDWLKTMKKVHDNKLPQGSEQMDASVNKLAEKSNKEAEVVTEAMAEAFLQQGKQQKAKDIYLKLSLLNPSKNAYFAAKLEQFN